MLLYAFCFSLGKNSIKYTNAQLVLVAQRLPWMKKMAAINQREFAK